MQNMQSQCAGALAVPIEMRPKRTLSDAVNQRKTAMRYREEITHQSKARETEEEEEGGEAEGRARGRTILRHTVCAKRRVQKYLRHVR